MKVTGDLGALAELRNRIRSLPQVGERIASRAAPAITGLAVASFDAGQSPTGQPWAPLKDGSARRNFKTGALRGALRFVPSGTMLRASIASVRYARYKIGRGDILPRGGSPLPVAWKQRLREVSVAELDAAMGKR